MAKRQPAPRVKFERRIAGASRKLVRDILHDGNPHGSEVYTRALLRKVALTAARMRDQLFTADELNPPRPTAGETSET